MATKINDFISSLTDASLPEHQQSFLLSPDEGDVNGGDNVECSNASTACGHDSKNYSCINEGDGCIGADNIEDCVNIPSKPSIGFNICP